MHSLSSVLLFTCLLGFALAELIKNGDFESRIRKKDWVCSGGCSVEQDPDAFSGEFSARVYGRSRDKNWINIGAWLYCDTKYISSNLYDAGIQSSFVNPIVFVLVDVHRMARRRAWSSLGQDVHLEPHTPYELRAKVKVGELPRDSLFEKIMVRMQYQFEDGSSDTEKIASMPYTTPEEEWVNITTVFMTHRKGLSKSTLTFGAKSAGIEFRLDDVSLTPLTRNPTWKQDAGERIRQNRMSDLVLKVTMGDEVEPADVEIKVELKKHRFTFGSVLHVNAFNNKKDPVYDKYREYFFENFNLAVLADGVRWKPMERSKGTLRREKADETLQLLENRGVPVKGHCLIWGMEDKVPAWMLQVEDVTAEVDRRLQYMSDMYPGRFTQWDVYNEQLHGAWFEQKSRNVNFLNNTFEKAHRLYPDTKLFLNDFNLLNGPEYTGALVHSAKKLVGQGSPVHGIGMQSHFRNEKKLDIDIIARRLEILGEAGLPLWATEFDVNVTDATSKADWYEDVLYLLYGDPNVEGIIIWGYWSEAHWRPLAALVDGMNFQENEAGRRIRSLWNDVWSTRASIIPDSRESTSVVRAFHGEYEVHVYLQSEHVTTLQVGVLDTSPSTTIEINI